MKIIKKGKLQLENEKNLHSRNLVRGFTLLEVVISIGILVIVGGVAVAASTRAINIQTYSKNRTRAQDLARNQMERAKAMRDTDYREDNSYWNSGLDRCLRMAGITTALTPASGFIGTNDFGADADIFIDFYGPTCNQGYGTRKWFDSPLYEVRTSIEIVPDNFNGDNNGQPLNTDYVNERENMRRITISVTWDEPFLRDRQEVKLMSYITNDQLGR